MDQTHQSSTPAKSKIIVLLLVVPALFLFVWPLLLLYILCFTNYGLVTLLYLAWMIYDSKTPENGGRWFEKAREFSIFKTIAEYFPVKLVKTADLDPAKNYLLCLHPHGIIPVGGGLNFSTEATGVGKLFPGIRPYVVTVRQHFYFPIHREFLINVAGAISASEQSLRHVLSDAKGGNAPVLSIGGRPEMLDAHPNTYVIHLSRRKGFVRVALQCGSPLVPVFTFGENDIADQWANPEGSTLRKLQNFILKQFGLPVITLKSLIPKSHRLITVAGEPLVFEQNLHPTTEEVDRLHSKYVEALQNLFYKHRDDYGESDRQLTIV